MGWAVTIAAVKSRPKRRKLLKSAKAKKEGSSSMWQICCFGVFMTVQ